MLLIYSYNLKKGSISIGLTKQLLKKIIADTKKSFFTTKQCEFGFNAENKLHVKRELKNVLIIKTKISMLLC